MKFRKHIVVFLLCAVFSLYATYAQINYNSTAKIEQQAQNRIFTHTVKTGETLYSIATAYKTTVEEIYELNPGSKQGIRIGQELKVPQLTSKSQTSLGSNAGTHTIQAKETLYSVSQRYLITVGELVKANPGLSEETFSMGRQITIPDVYAAPAASNTPANINNEAYSSYGHKVGPKETLYNISQKYACTVNDILKENPNLKQTGLQEGYTIRIPRKAGAQTYAVAATNAANQDSPTHFLPQDGIVRVALLLPFINGSKTVLLEKITEYYEGFLLAVQRMKEQGLNAEIYTFDIGEDNDTRRLESILGTNELNSLNLIIGGVSNKQVELIGRFAQRTGIQYVVPFSNKNSGVEYNPYIYQVVNSHSNLFPQITRSFANQFKGSHVIFLSEMGSDKDKAAFIKDLQKELVSSRLAFQTAPTSASIIDDLNAVIDRSRHNIIVPISSSENTLKRAMEAVEVLSRNNINISLFGYPEWQTYVNKIQRMHRADTYMYGTFYLDENNAETQLFANRYKRWYNKPLVVSYPKFAHMGYDTGIVFLTALQKLGSDFSSRLDQLNIHTIQSSLHFESVGNRGGYINKGVYLINLKPDGSVVKTELSTQ